MQGSTTAKVGPACTREKFRIDKHSITALAVNLHPRRAVRLVLQVPDPKQGKGNLDPHPAWGYPGWISPAIPSIRIMCGQLFAIIVQSKIFPRQEFSNGFMKGFVSHQVERASFRGYKPSADLVLSLGT